MVELELKFFGDAARFINETPLSDDQVVTEIDTQCRVLKATVRDCYEIRKFIRGYGEAVEVIAPQNIREALAAEYRLLLSRYTDV